MNDELQPEMGELIDLLFRENEDPFFIDKTEPLFAIAREPDAFIEKASAYFGVPLRQEHLGMNIPEIAKYLRERRTNSR